MVVDPCADHIEARRPERLVGDVERQHQRIRRAELQATGSNAFEFLLAARGQNGNRTFAGQGAGQGLADAGIGGLRVDRQGPKAGAALVIAKGLDMIDTGDNIEQFMTSVDEAIAEGLATIERVQARVYRGNS